jgi:uncharacterized membrane protein YbaN (DUF454 family)
MHPKAQKKIFKIVGIMTIGMIILGFILPIMASIKK